MQIRPPPLYVPRHRLPTELQPITKSSFSLKMTPHSTTNWYRGSLRMKGLELAWEGEDGSHSIRLDASVDVKEIDKGSQIKRYLFSNNYQEGVSLMVLVSEPCLALLRAVLQQQE